MWHENPALAMDLVAICGANASGKTRLGVRLAQRWNGEVLSVDSRQVYRGLDLGSGKDREEYRTPAGNVPCHLVDIADPRQIYSLWHFLHDFAAAYQDVRHRGRLPVAVGGTGLYLEAVLRGYRVSSSPPDPRLRAALRGQQLPELLTQLRRLDPDLLARTDQRSKRRVIRALEVAMGQHGGSQLPAPPVLRLQPLVIGVRWERELLRQRIAVRLEARLAAGLVDEVRRLRADGLSARRLEQLGMEYRHVSRFLDGRIDREQMVRDLRRDIGRLAKRQETYFRGMARRGISVHWVEGADPDAALAQIEAWMRAAGGSGSQYPVGSGPGLSTHADSGIHNERQR